MNRDEAWRIATGLVEQMRPFCGRIEIAGSIRRGKPEVKDIEMVAIPKFEEIKDAHGSLFGYCFESVNRLYEWAMRSGIRWIKPGVSEIIDWNPKPDGKYWRALLAEGIKLDLFLARPENFGAIYLIRTGSAEFSQAVVTHAKRIHKPCRDGFFTLSAQPVATPEEADVFSLLNLEYVEPRLRTDGSVLRSRQFARVE